MQVDKNGVLKYKGECAVIRMVLSQGQGQRLTKVDRVDSRQPFLLERRENTPTTGRNSDVNEANSPLPFVSEIFVSLRWIIERRRELRLSRPVTLESNRSKEEGRPYPRYLRLFASY